MIPMIELLTSGRFSLIRYVKRIGSGGGPIEQFCNCLDSTAKVGQALDGAILLLVGGAALEAIEAKLVVHRAILEHVVDCGQDGGEDSRGRLLGAAPRNPGS